MIPNTAAPSYLYRTATAWSWKKPLSWRQEDLFDAAADLPVGLRCRARDGAVIFVERRYDVSMLSHCLESAKRVTGGALFAFIL
jgi:hypothetical protein